MMSVSVVIPAYRAACTIRRAVDSALGQTSPPAEILVIDDGSPDAAELAAALRPLAGNVTLLHKPNGGAASARNHGIDHAQAEWVAFLDADDYWEPEKLARQLAVLQSHPTVGVIGCRWYEEVPGRPRTAAATAATMRYCGQLLHVRGREAFEAALAIWTGSLLVRRDALKTERFITGLEPAEDRDLWIRLLANQPAYILPDLLATYVQEPGGISRSNIDWDLGSMLQVVQRHAELLGRSGLRAQEAMICRRGAGVHLSQGRPTRAFHYARRRLRLQPLSAQAWWAAVKSAAQSAVGSLRRKGGSGK